MAEFSRNVSHEVGHFLIGHHLGIRFAPLSTRVGAGFNPCAVYAEPQTVRNVDVCLAGMAGEIYDACGARVGPLTMLARWLWVRQGGSGDRAPFGLLYALTFPREIWRIWQILQWFPKHDALFRRTCAALQEHHFLSRDSLDRLIGGQEIDITQNKVEEAKFWSELLARS